MIQLLVFFFFLLSDSQPRYWADYNPCCQQRILESNKIANIVKTYVKEEWRLSDDNRTVLLLEELSQPQKDIDKKALYFYVLNSIILERQNDGAIGEVVVDYVYRAFRHDSFYVLYYLYTHQEYEESYMREIAMYCYFSDYDVNRLRQEIEDTTRGRLPLSWLGAFFDRIGAYVERYKE